MPIVKVFPSQIKSHTNLCNGVSVFLIIFIIIIFSEVNDKSISRTKQTKKVKTNKSLITMDKKALKTFLVQNGINLEDAQKFEG